ncbi:MAG: SDR family NAD(P)-dependent oxidoreductase [Verrucomicrobium sp.]|nr:SDR family NAD(P)-dependent oxidoreductase [Verrucomicrobium sp.]
MKKIFLTGASAGIGLLAARALCDRGYHVWGTGRKAENLPLMARFHPVVLNLNDPASIEAAFKKAEEEAGHFDVLINNAGAGVFGPLEAFSEAEFRAQLETLLLGPLQLIRLALPGFRQRQDGLILNISSLAAEFPLPFLNPYSLSKAALSSMTEGLRLELAHTGIRLCDLRPGDFATQFHLSTRRIDGPLNEAYAPNLDRAWQAIDRNMNRAPDPQKVADTVVRIVEGEITRPVVAVGDVFQARIAPLLARLAPRRWVQWGLRVYYGLVKRRR